MELSIDAERIARGILGVLSFITLIVWCRWRGTPADEPQAGQHQATNSVLALRWRYLV
jgi:hypothetical protein